MLYEMLKIYPHECGQIELYNSMVDKEGTHNEKDAMRAYIAAREDNSTSSEVAEHEVSSALIDKVKNKKFSYCCFFTEVIVCNCVSHSCLLLFPLYTG